MDRNRSYAPGGNSRGGHRGGRGGGQGGYDGGSGKPQFNNDEFDYKIHYDRVVDWIEIKYETFASLSIKKLI